MKRTLSALAIAALAAISIAGPKHPIKVPKIITCAVLTKNKVNVQFALKHHLFADYKGNRYFFCCTDCPSMFKMNPAKYAKDAHVPLLAFKVVKKK